MSNDSMTGANVALLRGINVGGKNKLPMADLAAMFREAGATTFGPTSRVGTSSFGPVQSWLGTSRP